MLLVVGHIMNVKYGQSVLNGQVHVSVSESLIC